MAATACGTGFAVEAFTARSGRCASMKGASDVQRIIIARATLEGRAEQGEGR